MNLHFILFFIQLTIAWDKGTGILQIGQKFWVASPWFTADKPPNGGITEANHTIKMPMENALLLL